MGTSIALHLKMINLPFIIINYAIKNWKSKQFRSLTHRFPFIVGCDGFAVHGTLMVRSKGVVVNDRSAEVRM
jgi:uncharacterized integral membrane protein